MKIRDKRPRTEDRRPNKRNLLRKTVVAAGSGGEALSSFRISLRSLFLRRLKPAATCFAILFFALSLPVFAAFEDVEVGPRATAMGGAFVSKTDDPVTMFYNPAGLAGIKRASLSTAYEKMYMGLSDGSSLGRQILTFGSPIHFRSSYWGNVGFGYHQFSLSGLYKETTIKTDYAYPLRKNLLIGGGFNLLQVGYGSDQYTALNPVFKTGNNKSGYALDLGLIYSLRKFNFGLAVLNFNQPDMGLKYSNPVDRKIQAGISLIQEGWNLNSALVLAGSDIRLKIGTEAWLFRNRVAVRGGLDFGSREYRRFAFGAGYKNDWYRIDYSLNFPMGGLSGFMASHQIGVTLLWGKGLTDETLKEEEIIPGVDSSKFQTAVEMAMENVLKRLNENRVQSSTGPVTGFLAREELGADELKRQQQLISQVRQDLDNGQYSEALTKLLNTDEVSKRVNEVRELTTKIEPLVKVFGVNYLTEDDKKSYLLKVGLNAYVKGDGVTALDALTHAYQLWPDSTIIEKIHEFIMGTFPKLASEQRLVQGLNLIDQKLQEALELMYKEQYLTAILKCQEVLRLEPKNVLAMKRMGSAYWALEYEDIAKSIWRKALPLSPNDKQLIEFLNSKRTKTGKPKTETAVDHSQEEYERGIAFYKKLKDSGESKDILKKALERMIEKFDETGVDITYLRQEYKELE